MQSRWLCMLYIAACHKTPHRELVFALDCPASTDLGPTLDVARDMLDEKGADNPTVDVRDRQLVVSMPADTSDDMVAALAELVARPAKVEWRIVDDTASHALIEPEMIAPGVSVGSDGPTVFLRAADVELDDLTPDQSRALGCSGTPHCHLPGHKVLADYVEQLHLTLPSGEAVAYGHADERAWRTYVVRPEPALDPASVTHVEPTFSDRDHPSVRVTLSVAAVANLHALAGRRLAILLDGRVKHAFIVPMFAGNTLFIDAPGAPDLERERNRDELATVLRLALRCPMHRV